MYIYARQHVHTYMYTLLHIIAPSVITFCPSNSPAATTTTVQDVCLCLPLYQLQNRSNPKNITVNTELKHPSSAFSGITIIECYIIANTCT